MTPVAVTGIGVVSALGLGVEPFWNRLLAGASGIAPAGPGGLPAGVVAGLEIRDVAQTPGGRRMDRVSMLALAAARRALMDAALDLDALVPARTGLALGSALGDIRETVPFLDRILDRGTGNPLAFPNLVMNAALSYTSIELGITGPTAMLSEAEVSGEAAIAWGASAIADRACDVCLAGGADEIADVLFSLLAEARELTRDVPRPLDAAADGRALGEGAAVLVLEPAGAAHARGARVYAELVPHPGFGVPAPVHGHPRDPEPIARGLRAFVADADLVVACASGLPARDALEAEALAQASGGRPIAVTAPRGAFGDFGAAGALGVAAAALALCDGRVPPTLGCRPPARAGLAVVSGTAVEVRPRVAVVSAVGSGGICRPLRLVRSSR